MRHAILVRVTTNIVIQGTPAISLWIVATNDPKEAVAAVGKLTSLGCDIEAIDTNVLAETVKRLGLAPGQARQL